jgi:anti-anti-sigma regulatory factor
MLDIGSDDHRMQRLGLLIRWLTPTIVVFALTYGAIGAAFQDTPTLLSAMVIALYAATLLVAHLQIRRQHVTTAAYLVGGGLIAAVLVLTVLQPALYPNYAMVPLLVAAVLLQYAPRQHAGGYLASCGLAIVGIAILGALLPSTTALPAALLNLLRVSSMAATGGFTLFMLGQFSRQLTTTLDQVQTSNVRLEAQNADMALANQTISTQLEEQQRLLELVTLLEVPTVTLADGVLFTPLLGHMDSRRTEAMTSRLLQTVDERQVGCVIFDTSGLTVLDTAVAARLVQTFQALRLLGCRVFLSGISSAMALTITHLGIHLEGIEIVQSPQDALARLVR